MAQFPNRSFWIDQYGDYAPHPPLGGDLKVDVAVIGAGFNGLSTAWHLKQGQPSLSVAVLENEIVGYGASGRSGGWVMTQFGLDQSTIRSLYGKKRSNDAYHYASKAVDYVKALIETHDMQSDYSHPGLLRVAFNEKWIKKLDAYQAFYNDIGVGGTLKRLSKDELDKEFNSPYMLEGLYDPNMGMLDPCKHVREWKRLCLEAGVQIFENTPAVEVNRGSDRIEIKTPRGTITTEKLALSTNGYSHLMSGNIGKQLKRLQRPMYVKAVVTEKLTDRQWEKIGWQSRCAIEGATEMYHWFRPTNDGRIVCGIGYYLYTRKGEEVESDYDMNHANAIETHLKTLFPALKDLRIAQQWGGCVSASFDMIPHVGFLGDERIVYNAACWSHGVALSQLNGRAMSDLLLERESELTDFWAVKRQGWRWPAEPIGYFLMKSAIGLFKWTDRGNVKNTPFNFDNFS